jgi:ParB family chromosome partitioning protein
MSPQPRGLGRGLGALIPAGPPSAPAGVVEEPTGAGIRDVPVDNIMPNPRQPRSVITPDTLAELAASIREHGLIQPIIVMHAPPTEKVAFQLIAGERRWRAAQIAGLKTVPVLIKEATSQQLLELALVENIQRADLNSLEEATAFQALVAEFGLSQQEVADRVGKSRVAVANILRLLRLPDQVKALLVDGALSEGHARALLALEDDDAMIRAAEQVVARELTVRQTEELVRRLQAVVDAAHVVAEEPNSADDPDISYTRRLEEAFRGALGTKVSLSRGRRGGKLVIHFYSDEELDSIYEHIVGES